MLNIIYQICNVSARIILIINVYMKIHIAQISLCLSTQCLYIYYFHKKFRVFLKNAVRNARHAKREFIFSRNPIWCRAVSDQLKKAPLCLCCVGFLRTRRKLSGGNVVSSIVLVSENFVKNSDSDSFGKGAMSGHRFVRPCPLTGLVKSKNNITPEPRTVMQMNTAM